MRFLYTLFTLAMGGAGLFYLAEKNPQLKEKAEEILNFRTTTAMEIRYGADQIMEKEQRALLREKGARFLDPELTFVPYLVLEVKYNDGRRTKEGVILWDLTDGEMVLDTKSWEKTHGFADCILTGAHRGEVEIVTLLAKKGGSLDQKTIADHLEIDLPMAELLLSSCQKKNLILSTGSSRYRLHLENPKLTSTPETSIDIPLASKGYKRASRAPSQYSIYQVKKIAQLAFGESFSIRKSSEIFLPVHRICVQQGSGAIETTSYNALTGKRLPTLL